MRGLYVASEYAPLVKTGGLGDVCGALPRALRAMGVDVRVLLPGYPAVLGAVRRKRLVAAIGAQHGFPPSRLLRCEAPHAQPLYAIDCPALYAREGLYQDRAQRDWPDNALRFGLLARGAAILARGIAPRAWRPAVLHCNDWHAPPTPPRIPRAPRPAAAELRDRGIGVPRPDFVPESGTGLLGPDHHGEPHLRARNPGRGARLRAGRRAAREKRAAHGDPERNRHGRLGPEARSPDRAALRAREP